MNRLGQAGVILLILWGTLGSATAQQPTSVTPQTPAEWRNTAKSDIAFAVAQTRENHPGMHDPLNPGFAGRLEKAAVEATGLADRIESAAGYRAVISRFNTLIGDGHAGAAATIAGDSTEVRWPGFVAVWRGSDGLRVYASETVGAPVGARIVSCDQVPIKELITRNVFAFNGRISEEGNWWIYARSLFIDRGNPFVMPPRECVFETTAAAQSTVALNWRPIDATFEAWRRASYNGDELPVGLSTQSRLLWIAMPTFQPDEPERTAYIATAQSLRSDRSQVENARAIVLDLRQNSGGSSEWPYEIAKALWGEAAVVDRMSKAYRKVEIWWRTSSDNAAHVLKYAKVMREEGRIESADAWDRLGNELTQAAAKGDIFYVTKENENPQKAPTPTGPLAARMPPVFLIVPGQCASACLDALDIFAQFGTTFVGAPSSADSTYMEVRVQPTPSGLANVILPMKIWVHRPRGPGEFYNAVIEARSIDWSTEQFATLINRELDRRKK